MTLGFLRAEIPDALVDLRTRRSGRRTERIDPFDAFYQAYVTALLAGMGMLLVSSWIGDQPVETSSVRLAGDGRAVLALLTAIAAGTGLRAGSRGGPLAVERAELRHVLLAPVLTGPALRAPAIRQLRFLVATAAATGAIGGQLASHRLPGDALAWMLWGVVWAVTSVVLAVALGWIACGLRVRSWLATTIAAGVVGWSLAAVALDVPAGPLGAIGGLGVVPLELDAIGLLVGPALAAGAAIIGSRLLGGVSFELLSRRTALIGQLRFAATMRDLRTVMLLRRQLNQERPRTRPWLPARQRGGRTVVVLRDWRALMRTPLTRLVRLVGLALAATVAAIGVWQGTTALLAVAGLASFLAGLEALEPLAQEVDHCTFLDLAPLPKGPTLVRHLIVPTGVMLALGLAIGAGTALLAPPGPAAGLALVIALVAPVASTAGAAISIMRDGGTPGSEAIDQLMLPPEAVGMRLLYRMAWPPAVATAGFAPLLVARNALETGLDPVRAATSVGVMVVLLGAVVAAWVRYGDELRTRWAEAAAQATTST